ncbi:MAG TPA: hypothetical protein EYG52_19560 [Pseudomonadales bacterium]|nr:hypothetical protein [Gammaproteobacteria bacterium]HIL85694.1 hypothetical protein [Pseudomonadales bacterium]
MPELPVRSHYIDSLKARIIGEPSAGIRFLSPFMLRSVDPPADEINGKPIQRIRYSNDERHYWANCQSQGNLLGNRSLSRLLKKVWRKTLEEHQNIARLA